MKYTNLSLLVGGLIASVLPLATLSAQPEGGKKGAMSVEKRLDQMKENLSLTDDQVSKLKPILEEQKTKLDAIRADDTLEPKDKRQQAKQVMDDTKTKIEGVLTSEQKEKFDQSKKHGEKGKGKKKGKGKNKGGNAAGDDDAGE